MSGNVVLETETDMGRERATYFLQMVILELLEIDSCSVLESLENNGCSVASLSRIVRTFEREAGKCSKQCLWWISWCFSLEERSFVIDLLLLFTREAKSSSRDGMGLTFGEETCESKSKT